MLKYGRALVPLDLTYIDNFVLNNLRAMSGALDLDKVYFLHIEPNLEWVSRYPGDLPDEVKSLEPLDERLRLQMENRVQAEYGLQGDRACEYLVEEGSAFEQILHWGKVKKADLIVMGRKSIGKGSGIVSAKIARQARASVLFIPEQEGKPLKRVVVPVDFSKDSAQAMKAALAMKQGVPSLEIRPVHIYDVPTQYHQVLRTLKQFEIMMRDNAIEAYGEFCKRYDLPDIEVVYQPNDLFNIAKHVNRFAVEHQADMVVVGAKGHSKLDLVLLGSVTEKILLFCDSCPVLVVKG